MKLFLKNIGKIGEADIEINGITVIAGENNVGKSTVGKALFAVMNVLPDLIRRIKSEKKSSISKVLHDAIEDDPFYMREYGFVNKNKQLLNIIAEDIIKDFFDSQNIHEFTKKYLKKLIDDRLRSFYTKKRKNSNTDYKYYEFFLDTCFNRIKNILELSNDRLKAAILQKYLEYEFSGQVQNIYSNKPAEISFMIKNNNIDILFSEDGAVENVKSDNFTIRNEAIYLDDPFVVDNLSSEENSKYFRVSRTHRDHLIYKLTSSNERSSLVESLIVRDKLGVVFQKLNDICSGNMTDTHSQANKIRKESDSGYSNSNRYNLDRNNRSNKTGYFGLSRNSTVRSYDYAHMNKYSDKKQNVDVYYKERNKNKKLNIKNLSAGLKSFVILKTLLLNGSIDYNSVLILDEPEIHLHPEWQLIFAEIIVLLQKEFDLHILLNTHSPYFLNALEIYAAKHDIGDKCKYYLAETEDNIAHIKDVTDNIEAIYYKLARPLQKLEDEKGDL